MESLSLHFLGAPPQSLDVWQTLSLSFRLRSRLSKQAFFHRKYGLCFSLLSVLCPRHRGQPGTVFLIVTFPWSSGTPVPLATRTRYSRSIHCVNCIHSLTLTGQLQCTGGGICLRASKRQWENVLTVHAFAFRNTSGQCVFCVHVPTLS